MPGIYFVGVDVGTGSARASLVNAHGRVLQMHVKKIQTWNPIPNHYEQSSDDIWKAVCECVRVIIIQFKTSSTYTMVLLIWGSWFLTKCTSFTYISWECITFFFSVFDWLLYILVCDIVIIFLTDSYERLSELWNSRNGIWCHLFISCFGQKQWTAYCQHHWYE